ncbi:MAG: sulfite exporter TauE/SafE family protein [Thaumarchaeota archaeon]|nr:sulfite exporter TauE/SafE family protein [Nitrososphaerota archaeon]
MPLDPLLEGVLGILLPVLSGIVVGASLSLTGGGGSILAVPLLIYLIGIKDPHQAIGTSALVVGAIAAASMINHRAQGNLRVREGLTFGIPGVAGTLIGSQLGILTPSSELLLLFAIFMIVMGYRVFTRKPKPAGTSWTVQQATSGRRNLAVSGVLVGIAAGYFGIGGGFLIVPALMHSAGLDIVRAIGTSLLPVSMFGFSTGIRYTAEGQISWQVAIPFVAGGLAGAFVGTKLVMRIPQQALLRIFGLLMFAVAGYMIFRTVLG